MFVPGGKVYKALVKSSDSTTGEIYVAIPNVLGDDAAIPVSFIGRSATNGVWAVPTPGTLIAVGSDDDQFSNVFWFQTSGNADTSAAPRGIVAYQTVTSGDTFALPEKVQITTTFTAVANRYYKITYFEPGFIVSGSTSIMRIRQTNISGTILNGYSAAVLSGERLPMTVMAVSTFSAGSVTVVGTTQQATNGVTRSATSYGFLMVEDIGAVL